MSILKELIALQATYPGGNATTAVSQGYRRFLHPRGSEAVKEVGLASHFAILEVRIAKLADVDLQVVSRESSSWLV